MIRHCVFVNFQVSFSKSQKTELFNKIDELKKHLPGIINVFIGSNVSPEAGMDKGFSDGFIVDFETAADRDRYLEDAQHQQIGSELVKAAQDGVAGILVYDLEVDGA